jgi:N-acylneuraminate cytidylyltransferase
MRSLFLIPARYGSKGLPRKNIKMLRGKPLISYSLEFAIENADLSKDIICLSSDDEEVIEISKNYPKVQIPFIRPAKFSTDSASTFDVILHALDYYSKQKVFFETLILLQPTSPLRINEDFYLLNKIFRESQCDMAVSVRKSKDNPYFSLFEESKDGFLRRVNPNGSYKTRQECPEVYVYNGSMYFVKVDCFLEKGNFNFDKIVKYEMPFERSVDIDYPIDWLTAEFYLSNLNEN